MKLPSHCTQKKETKILMVINWLERDLIILFEKKEEHVMLCYALYIPFVWWCDWLAVLLVQILVGPAGQIPKDCFPLLSGPYSSVLNQMHPNSSLNYAHWSHLQQLHIKKNISLDTFNFSKLLPNCIFLFLNLCKFVHTGLTELLSIYTRIKICHGILAVAFDCGFIIRSVSNNLLVN